MTDPQFGPNVGNGATTPPPWDYPPPYPPHYGYPPPPLAGVALEPLIVGVGDSTSIVKTRSSPRAP